MADWRGVLDWYRLVFDLAIPNTLTRFAKTSFAFSNIPYVYPTVKSKCWLATLTAGSFSKHVCEKPGHACLRSIVSFVKLPCKKIFQRIGRALSLLVSTFCPGWSFNNLDVAPGQLADRAALLRPDAAVPRDGCDARRCPYSTCRSCCSTST